MQAQRKSKQAGRVDHEAAALVRAIRQAYGKASDYGALERFTVYDIHDFARRLVAAGVRAE
jgi:hypothetical protein